LTSINGAVEGPAPAAVAGGGCRLLTALSLVAEAA